MDSNSPTENDDHCEDASYLNNKGKTYLYNKKYAICIAAIVGIACTVYAAVRLPYGDDDNDLNLPTLSYLAGGDVGRTPGDWKDDYAFQKGMFKDVTLANQFGRTLSGDKENPITNTDYCRYLHAQLKDNNGNWKFATYNLDKYIYVNKDGDLKHANEEKQPGHYTYSIKSCYVDVWKIWDFDCGNSGYSAYNVKLHAETMYSGGLFGNKDKTKDASIFLNLLNDDGSFVDIHYNKWGKWSVCPLKITGTGA